jgi:hypothetical protein
VTSGRLAAALLMAGVVVVVKTADLALRALNARPLT